MTSDIIVETGWAKNLVRQLHRQRSDPQSKCCDVVFEVENKLLPCHRAVLSAIDCQQLRDVLSIQEAPMSIKLEDFPFDGVTAVLDFIYTGHAHISSENVQNILTVSTYFSIHQLRNKCESFLHELQTLSPSLTVNDLTENILAQNNNEPIPPASASNRAEANSSDERATEATATHQPAPFMTNECPSSSDITHLFDIIRTSHPQPTQHNPLDTFLVPMQTIQLNDPENDQEIKNCAQNNLEFIEPTLSSSVADDIINNATSSILTIVSDMTERACEICNRHFVSQDELDRHFQSEHMNMEKKFECTICGKKLANRKTLAQHRRSHRNTLKSRQSCEYCSKTFSTKANYNAHLKRMHPAECQLPITVHQCGECNRSFPRATDLRTHQKRHLNIREHKCTYCEQSFVTKSSLQVHLRRHNGEKPYKCTECSAEFVDSCGLKRHIDNIHSEVRWKCGDCEKIFRSKSALQKHEKQCGLVILSVPHSSP
ncbi:unnamed protein product [Oikopleura dioica]|uniref:Uncharacterized protein n=1 Tax=Oikopleura dioica TaxID=34765 RepID=E4WZY3_OIKDI|nr:unnamed protein product [Oikopleura dioica]